jgi:DNA invertase Pin-like site-specific DNA recombinase
MASQKPRTANYARISTLDQDPAMQLHELRAYAAHRRLPIAAEFIDQVSGTTADRPALEEFRHLGVDFISVTEQIDTSSPMGKAMFTVISAIAEFEHSLISERVRAGIAKARANGTRHGRPKLDPRIIGEIRRLRSAGQSLHRIARQLGISHQTVANYASGFPIAPEKFRTVVRNKHQHRDQYSHISLLLTSW